MEYIPLVNISSARNEEAFGFFELIAGYVDNYLEAPTEPEAVDKLEPYKTAFIEAFEALDEVMEKSDKLPGVQRVNEAKAAVDTSYRNLRKFFKGMKTIPDEEMASLATSIINDVEQYDDPTTRPQIEKTGIISNLIDDLKLYTEDSKEKVHLDLYLNDLEKKFEEYKSAIGNRSWEKSQVKKNIVEERRSVTTAAYRELIHQVNIVASYEGVDDYQDFIDYTTSTVEHLNSVLKTRRSSKKEEDGKPKPDKKPKPDETDPENPEEKPDGEGQKPTEPEDPDGGTDTEDPDTEDEENGGTHFEPVTKNSKKR